MQYIVNTIPNYMTFLVANNDINQKYHKEMKKYHYLTVQL